MARPATKKQPHPLVLTLECIAKARDGTAVRRREASKRKRFATFLAALSIENARITSAVPMPRKRESKRPR